MEESPKFVAPIYKDPIGWAGTIVGTNVRYLLSLVIVPIFTLSILADIAASDLSEYWSSALLIVAIQIMFLFVMRRLYTRLKELEA
jgi:L-cystine uptake protein TcyP (sodium:dicarboxylate symporter family)